MYGHFRESPPSPSGEGKVVTFANGAGGRTTPLRYRDYVAQIISLFTDRRGRRSLQYINYVGAKFYCCARDVEGAVPYVNPQTLLRAVRGTPALPISILSAKNTVFANKPRGILGGAERPPMSFVGWGCRGRIGVPRNAHSKFWGFAWGIETPAP